MSYLRNERVYATRTFGLYKRHSVQSWGWEYAEGDSESNVLSVYMVRFHFMVNVPKSLYARYDVRKKNAILLEYFRSRRRSRNISYVYTHVVRNTLCCIRGVSVDTTTTYFFRGGGVLLRRHELEKECFVVVVWRRITYSHPGVLA
jgi:hypothetical protein